jgi:hypothetical protein
MAITRLAFACVAVALVLGVALSDDVSEEKMSTMSKEELIAQLSSTQKEAALTRSQLSTANNRITDLHARIQHQQEGAALNEKQRVAAEKHKKYQVKQEEAKKRAQKLKKKQKLEDVLMEHTARFVAMKTAKKFANKDAKTQKTHVMKAALDAARAGAVGPLRKVARAEVAAAVKKARKDSKAAGKDGKHYLHKMSMIAAKSVFKQIMKKQNDLVSKTVDKVTKEAFAKYPASFELAEDDAPQHFTAPPSIHIGLLDDTEGEQPASKPKADDIVPEH